MSDNRDWNLDNLDDEELEREPFEDDGVFVSDEDGFGEESEGDEEEVAPIRPPPRPFRAMERPRTQDSTSALSKDNARAEDSASALNPANAREVAAPRETPRRAPVAPRSADSSARDDGIIQLPQTVRATDTLAGGGANRVPAAPAAPQPSESRPGKRSRLALLSIRRPRPSLPRIALPRPRLPRPAWPRFLQRRRPGAAEAAIAPAREDSARPRRSQPEPSLFFRWLDRLKGRGEGRRRGARRRQRRPRLVAAGLSLDDKLDILGVFLVIASAVLVLSALSADPGALIGPINDFLGRLLGQGALAVPITMFALGVWLILRYFGDGAPLMDLWRGSGALLVYLSALVILQIFETFTAAYRDVSLSEPQTLRLPLELTWTLKRAGGWLGAELYWLLVTTVGELGSILVLAGVALLGLRFMTGVSTYEMARWSLGLWRRVAEKRAARHEERQAARAEREREAAERLAQREKIAAAQAARREREAALMENVAPATTPPPPPEPIPQSALSVAGPALSATPPPEVADLPEPKRDADPSPWRLPEYKEMLSGGGEPALEREVLRERAQIIEDTLRSFGAPGRVVAINSGPVITQFGVKPLHWEQRSGKRSRVKVGAIAQLEKDIQLALGARTIRVEAPVPGKGYVGVEVPNKTAALVSLRDVLDSDTFRRVKSPLAIALGQRVDGRPVVADLVRMPHLLIAGTTGSGKSVCVNAIINSILLRNAPQQVRFLMVDPKRVELTGYNGLPHLLAPVVVEMERTVAMLRWVAAEMDQRYQRFSQKGARDIVDYNEQLAAGAESLPYIIVIIDELADLMMTAPDITERLITRIAALARATGIHLVIATQRPSVDVVTGLIKANFPARIAFAVASGVDSRVVLDQPGAERLLGRGDMLFQSGEAPAPLRMQGVFVSDSEIEKILAFWREQGRAPLGPTGLESAAPPAIPTAQTAIWVEPDAVDEEEQLYEQAVALVQRLKRASVSLLQRRMRIGYNRSARLIDRMEAEGIIGPPTEGSKPRAVLKLPEEVA